MTPATPSRTAHLGSGSARSLLLTLLGEFVYPEDEPIWTGVLLRSLAGVDVGEKAARQAIARAAAAGWIKSEPNGRRTAWRLAESGRKLIAEGSQRLRSLTGQAARWGGEWLVLHITLPESRREDRLRIYRALSWFGFGNPTPGVWINPNPERAAQVRRLIEDRKLEGLTLAFIARSLDFGISRRELVAKAWDLDAVAAHYGSLVKRFNAMRPRSGDELLFAHIRLVNALQRLPSLDPGLPEELLPPGWTRRLQAHRLWELRERWRKPAHERWANLVADSAG